MEKRNKIVTFLLTKSEKRRLDNYVKTENTKIYKRDKGYKITLSDVVRRRLHHIILDFGHMKNPEIKKEVKK